MEGKKATGRRGEDEAAVREGVDQGQSVSVCERLGTVPGARARIETWRES